MILFALVKRRCKSWVNSKLAMDKIPSRAWKVLKIVDSISSVSRNALISSWNKVRGLEPTENPSDVDGEDLIELELFELEEPDEQPTEVSDDENEPSPPKK